MKKPMTVKKAVAIFTPCATAILAIMLALVIASSMFYKDISLFLYGRAQKVDAKALATGSALCEDIVEEGVVLLKNEEDANGNPALPLSEDEIAKVNVFGWAAFDWMTMAFGSGYTNTTLPKVKLFPALEEAGIEYNTDLYNLYENYYKAKSNVYNTKEDEQEYRGGVGFGSEEIFVLREPSKAQYEALSDSIKAFSSVGLVVIGRTGSESKDLQLQQVKQTGPATKGSNGYSSGYSKTTVYDRHYLQLSTEEEDMIQVAKDTCDKVIVILNTANTMETGFIADEGIDGALLVGITGLTGVNGLINVLRGEKPKKALDADGNVQYDADNNVIYETNPDGSYVMEKVSPSGRTADTYAYDILGTNPATLNQQRDGAARTYSSGAGNGDQDEYVDYSEGIYVGYKWYETADAEGFWNDVNNKYGTGYDGVVQFPFGYGLSYTEFEWKVNHVYINDEDQTSGTLPQNGKIEIWVEVTNTGNYPGMDVVELYYTAPYEEGEIEKAHVNLAAFAKTGVIPAGGKDTVVLELTVQSMASYDCYDANGNAFTGYELDGGEYQLRLMKNAHENAVLSKDSVTDAVIRYTVPATGYQYDTDEKTGEYVENRFTNQDGNGNNEVIDNNDLDGSRESAPVQYLTRANGFANFNDIKVTVARSLTAEALNVAKQMDPTAEQLEYAGYSNLEARSRETNEWAGGWTDIIAESAALDYDNPIWDEIIANISNSELALVVGNGYFKTSSISSLGKPEYVDLDGPLGFNTRVTGGNGTTCEFISYPSATMLAQTWNEEIAHQMGVSVGSEASSMEGLHGWYAPGGNIHRSPFGGRNGEYYSEDGVLAGKICAKVVQGAKEMGVYSYVKHFVANDGELGRNGLFTFMTEQTLREIYLKPFEITIKEGDGNALMTSMNRLGRVWSGGNYGLMTEIVRNEWGFHGTAVTDWIDPGSNMYMPPYRGIWAGNDIWLTNGTKDASGNMHLSQIDSLVSKNDPAALAMMEKVAHNVLWTFVDTVNYNPDTADIDYSKGSSYNLTWVWYVVAVEVVLAAGIGTMGFFLFRKKKSPAKTAK